MPSPLIYPLVPDEADFAIRYQPSFFDLSLSTLRVHYIGLVNWFNQRFKVEQGTPVPVIAATPMDAFSQFNQLWGPNNNPFQYLQAQGQPPGSPEVFPVDQRFPLISVDYQGFDYNPLRSYGSRVNRRLGWPTVDPKGTPGVTLSSLGEVAQARMPLALDYRYRITMWSMRPDMQAFLVEQLLDAMKVSASVLQTYIRVLYPLYMGQWLVKMRVDGPITNATEKSPVDQVMRYQTVFDLVIEGWRTDTQVRVTKALWSVIQSMSGLEPNQVTQLYAMNAQDFRPYQENPIVALRQATMPPGTVVGSVISGTVW